MVAGRGNWRNHRMASSLTCGSWAGWRAWLESTQTSLSTWPLLGLAWASLQHGRTGDTNCSKDILASPTPKLAF